MALHSVRWELSCELAAEALGGYEEIDKAIFIYLEALERNPYAFPKVDTDWGSTRYVRTKPYGSTPELLWYFLIEANGDVAIVYVEKF
jgi:hypothetical protein